MRTTVVFLGLLVVGSAAPAAEVQFAEEPTAARSGEKVTITFAVAGPTDVEVAILDAKGTVVRHLAAGVLGKAKPPPAPLKPGLEQTLIWDGTNDLGESAKGSVNGGFTVRVRLGLGVEFDGLIGENKRYMAAFYGMATDPKGNVYIDSSSVGNRGPGPGNEVRVFSRTGEYLRTLMPMPADLPSERVRALKVVITPDGRFLPRNRCGTWPVLYPNMSFHHAIASRVRDDGVICLFDGKRIGRIAADGGAADAVFGRDVWPKGQRPSGGLDRWFMVYPGFVATSPDGQWLYVTGVYQRKPQGNNPIQYPSGRIYRLRIKDGLLETFADLEGSVLAGVACDADGNLLVCDRTKGRVVVLSREAKEIGAIQVAAPRSVACHRRTGSVYVVATKAAGYFRAAKSLIKFDGWKEGAKEVARLDLGMAAYNAVMALDDSAEPPVIWVGIDRSKTYAAWRLDTRAKVLRLEDRGSRFVETPHGVTFDPRALDVVTRLAVHPENDLIVCRGEYADAAAFEGLTGKRVTLPFSHCVDMGVGLDGKWYVQTGYGWDGPLCRYDRDLRPVPAPTRASEDKKQPAGMVVPRIFGRWGAGFGTGGVTADTSGRIVSLQQLDQHTVSGDCIVAFGSDGNAENPGRMRDNTAVKSHGIFSSVLIGPIAGNCGGIGVDYAGYVYFGFQGLPASHKAPKGFESDAAYNSIVGTVIKMKPDGGSVFDIGGPNARPPRKSKPVPEGMTGFALTRRAGYPRGTAFVENGVTAYPGLGSVSGNFGGGCRCRQPMFQVDGFGRLFIPNAVTCSVGVVDNAGNLITRFGRYGNIDSTGAAGIPLGWPEAVGVSKKAVYVADVLNRRIVRARKTYAAEATCTVE